MVCRLGGARKEGAEAERRKGQASGVTEKEEGVRDGEGGGEDEHSEGRAVNRAGEHTRVGWICPWLVGSTGDSSSDGEGRGRKAG